MIQNVLFQWPDQLRMDLQTARIKMGEHANAPFFDVYSNFHSSVTGGGAKSFQPPIRRERSTSVLLRLYLRCLEIHP